jgi:hypothetical protein
VKVQGVHLGPRSENISDIVKMDYLKLNSGVVIKFSYIKYSKLQKWITKREYDTMMSNLDIIKSRFNNPNLKEVHSKKTGKDYWIFEYEVVDLNKSNIYNYLYKDDYVDNNEPKLKYYKIIRTNEDIDKSFEYFMDTDQLYGLDYETDGIPFDDPNFKHMGVGIAGANGISAYYDIEWMNSVGSNYEHFKDRYKKFLDKYEDKIYTYNVGFELRATYLIFKKMYNFHDSAALNYIDGNNYKRFSLKYTAMNYLKVPSWDDDFDFLLDVLPSVFHQSGEYSKYKTSPHYQKYIVPRYPNDLDEFDRLFKLYWGKPYSCIPSTILGKYCCIDSFNTVKIREKATSLGYSDLCWDTFVDNIRLSAQLSISGFHRDTKFQDESANKALHYMVCGQLNAAIYYLSTKLKRYDIKVTLGEGKFEDLLELGLNPINSKSFMRRYIDESYESGFNEELMLKELDIELSSIIQSHFNHNIKLSTLRSRNIFTYLDSKLKDYFNVKTIDNNFIIDGVELTEEEFNDLRSYHIDLYNYESLLKLNLNTNDPVSIYKFKDNEYNALTFIDVLKGIINLSSAGVYSDFIATNLTLNFDYYNKIKVLSLNRIELPEGALFQDMNNFELPEGLNLDEYNYLNNIIETTNSSFKDLYESLIKNSTLSVKFNTKEYEGYLRSGELYRANKMIFEYVNNNIYIKESSQKSKLIQSWYDYSHVTLVERLQHYAAVGAGQWNMLKLNQADKELISYNDDKFICNDNSFGSLWKLAYTIRMFRKYNKNYGTYLSGILCEGQCNTNEPDENGICIERQLPKSDSTIVKSYPKYREMSVKSKRWAAGKVYARRIINLFNCWEA